MPMLTPGWAFAGAEHSIAAPAIAAAATVVFNTFLILSFSPFCSVLNLPLISHLG